MRLALGGLEDALHSVGAGLEADGQRLGAAAGGMGLDLAAAGRGLSAFDARSYAPSIDVPAAVIVSMRDRLIWADRQRELAEAIPGARAIEIDVAHNGWLVHPDTVCAAIEAALDVVTEQCMPKQAALLPLHTAPAAGPDDDARGGPVMSHPLGTDGP